MAVRRSHEGRQKFCPDSKGVEEAQIMKAFVESYKLLCENADGVLEEFLARVEKIFRKITL